MAINGSSSVSNIYSSLGIKNNGIGGLVSGLDTDSLVEALTAGTRAKIAKQGQQKTLLKWQQTAYRDIRTTLESFRKSHFSASSGTDTNINSYSFFNTYKGTSSSSKLTLNSKTTTGVGSLNIDQIKQLASKQTLETTTTFKKELTCGEFTLGGTFYNKTMQFSMDDGTTKTIRLDDLTGITNAADFEAKLQEIITNAAGQRSPDPGVTLPPPATMVDNVKVTLTAVSGSTDKYTVNMTADRNKITIVNDNAKDTLGFMAGQCNRVTGSDKIGDLEQFKDLTEDTFKFKINGTTITLNKNDTVAKMMTTINSSAANVTLTFNNRTETFTFSAKVTGSGEHLAMEDIEGRFLNAFVGARGSNTVSSDKFLNQGYNTNIASAGTVTLAHLLNGLVPPGTTYTFSIKLDAGSSSSTTVPISFTIPDTADNGDGTYGPKNMTGEEYLKELINQKLTKTGMTLNITPSATPGDVTFSFTTTNKSEVQVIPGTTGTDFLSAGGFTTLTNSDPSKETLLSDLFKDPVTGVPSAGGKFTINIGGNDIVIEWPNSPPPPAGSGLTLSTISDLVAEINLQAGAPIANLEYGKLTLDPGASNSLRFKDDVGDAMLTLFGLSQYDGAGDSTKSIPTAGKNAEIIVNGQVISSTTNDFIVDGIGFTVNAESVADESLVITSEADVDGLFTNINNFINEYNVMVEAFNTILNEKKTDGYAPLTDEQKADMTDEQIKSWETEAKKGLLRNDPTLSRIMTDMRDTLTKRVEAAGLSLHDIGIETESFLTSGGGLESVKIGKLKVNEERLKNAIKEDPDGVRLLFANQDKDDLGFAGRLDKIIDSAVNTSTDYKVRGSLVAMAGTDIYGQDSDSIIARKLDTIDKYVTTLKLRLEKEYSRHWAKFTALESAMARLSAQSSWLTEQTASR